MKSIYFILFLIIISFYNCNQVEEKKNVTLENKNEITPNPNYPKKEHLILKNIDQNLFPDKLHYLGNLKNAFRWEDKLGDNIIILSETGIYEDEKINHENQGSDAELYAYHFIIEQGHPNLKWRVRDYIHDCPVDMQATFIDNSFQITDLDKNGVAEIWMVYQTACHGDVSPAQMKIIMYEDTQKHAMRGDRKIYFGTDENGNTQYDGGTYKFDDAFKKTNKTFKEEAIRLWNLYMMTSE